ncbi:MAG: porin family protein [Methanosarcina sp.]
MMYKHKLYKVIGLIMLCMVIITPLTAQDSTIPPLSYGVKVGIGSSGLALDYMQPLGQTRTTISAGLFAQYRVAGWLAINADLLYTQAGGSNVNSRLFYFKDSPMLGIPELNKTLDRTDLLMHRIEMPVTAHITPPGFEGSVRPVLIIGPSFGYSIRTNAINWYRWDFESAPNDLVTVTQDNLKSKLNNMDVAGVIGFGGDFDLKPVAFSLGVTYRMSFTETNNYMYSLFSNYTFNRVEFYFAVKL